VHTGGKHHALSHTMLADGERTHKLPWLTLPNRDLSARIASLTLCQSTLTPMIQ